MTSASGYEIVTILAQCGMVFTVLIIFLGTSYLVFVVVGIDIAASVFKVALAVPVSSRGAAAAILVGEAAIVVGETAILVGESAILIREAAVV